MDGPDYKQASQKVPRSSYWTNYKIIYGAPLQVENNEAIQYKKSKEPPKCTGLFLLYKWIESLFDHGNVLSTSTLGISNNCLKKFSLVIFYQGFEGQNIKLSIEDDFVFVENCISRLVRGHSNIT